MDKGEKMKQSKEEIKVKRIFLSILKARKL